MEKSSILITCPKGLPPYLKKELEGLGFPAMSEGIAGIETGGTLEDAMLLNLHIRTGHRVLFLVGSFDVVDGEALYRKVAMIEWERYIDEDGYLSVHSSVDNKSIKDTRFANLKCKDAIVDRIRNIKGKRPDSGSGMNGAVVFLYWKGEKASIYLDTSGEALSKRDYRMIPMRAPMQETLAAAVVLQSGWDGSGNFVNPMCGSGTLAIEAALIGLKRAPGLLRSNFGFMHLKGYDRKKWEALRQKAISGARKSLPGRIIATDLSEEAVRAARKNAATAGVEHLIGFKACDFRETAIPEEGGVVIVNPEYGERLGKIAELEDTYAAIGDFFKKKCKGYRGFIFTGNLELAKKVGLRPKSRTIFYNSNIECRLLEYELYEGSRKGEVS